jgi:uncharacterized membrane protein YccC
MDASREGQRDAWWTRGVAALRDPAGFVDLIQVLKTALAAGLAWWVATGVLHLEQPFLAPWAAVLVVHSTVYRTVSRGTQQVAATFLAVFLAYLLGTLLGVGAWSIGLVVLLGFLLGKIRWLRDEATTIATTGLVVLATDAMAEAQLLGRLLDTSVGVVVGLAVNLLVWPPLRDRAAWSQVDQIPHDLAAVVREIADGLGADLEPADVDQWVRDCREVDLRIDRAWQLLSQAQESGRLNPRRSRPTGVTELNTQLHLLEQATADTLSTARTVATSAENKTVWDEQFRSRWKELARATADGVDARDPAALEAVGRELGDFVRWLSDDALPRTAWQEYGGLLTNLRNVHDALATVTESNHSAQPGSRRSKRYAVRPGLPGRPRR